MVEYADKKRTVKISSIRRGQRFESSPLQCDSGEYETKVMRVRVKKKHVKL
jgi:hypothetical protein